MWAESGGKLPFCWCVVFGIPESNPVFPKPPTIKLASAPSIGILA